MQSFHFLNVHLQVLNILSLVALVFVFTTTGNPAEEHGKIVFTFYYLRRNFLLWVTYCNSVIFIYSHCIVNETAHKSEHAAEGHATAGMLSAVHLVEKVEDPKKHEPSRHAREAKAAQQHETGARLPRLPLLPRLLTTHQSKPIKYIPRAA